MHNYVCHRPHLVQITALHHDKELCKISLRYEHQFQKNSGKKKGGTDLGIDKLSFFQFSFRFYDAPYRFPPGLMIVLCNLGSELPAILKKLNRKCCYIFGFSTSKSLCPRFQEISKITKFLVLIVFTPLMTWITIIQTKNV